MSAINGEALIFGQHNGNDIPLIVYGDEFYARYETRDGYTVVYDLDKGSWCYATLSAGHLVSSGVGIDNLIPRNLRRHLREVGEIRNFKFDQRYRELRGEEIGPPSGVSMTFGPNSGLLSGRQVTSGNVKGLTIMVEFEDHQTGITRQQVDAMLNDLDFHGHGNFCSVRRYYQLMSSGKLDYTNDVIGPVKLPRNRSFYINNSMVPDVLAAAIDQFGIRLDHYDSQGHGIVDALSIMYAGQTSYTGMLWPHNSRYRFDQDGTRTHYYTIQSLGRRAIDLGIGTFCHESGHMLARFPDLYDYGKRDGDFQKSSGLGYYCLMSAGNHLKHGKVPAPLCAYLRYLAGWCDNVVELDGENRMFEAKHGDYNTVYRHSTSNPTEYFLIENRYRQDLDMGLPDSGLAVYHCDTLGSNEHQDGTATEHYQCALLQADGRRDLETTTTNRGDQSDLFDEVQGMALDDHTTPSSLQWDGSDSNLRISNITRPGEVIGFRIGEADETSGAFEHIELADLIIPDDNNRGITSAIEVPDNGMLQDITVMVDISHTYRGDLVVDLITPNGLEINLHHTEGRSLDDLELNLESATHQGLRELDDVEIRGTWKLNVKDLVSDDVGRLNGWGIHLEYKNS